MFRWSFAFASSLVFAEQAKHILSCCCLNINYWKELKQESRVSWCCNLHDHQCFWIGSQIDWWETESGCWVTLTCINFLPQSCRDWSLEHFFCLKWKGDKLIKRTNALSILIFYFRDLDILVTFTMSSKSFTRRFVWWLGLVINLV